MTAPRANDDVLAVLPMPDSALSLDQARRATCLALALALLRGRNVHVQIVREIACWIYDGETGKP